MKKNIGITILKLREKFKFSQAELAKKINVKPQTIYKYENGIIKNIKYETIEKLAKIFNVTPQYILGNEEKPLKILTKENIRIENMAFFGNKEISDEDKEELFNALQEFYFKQKLEKK